MEVGMQRRFTRLFARKHASIIFEQTCPHIVKMENYYNCIERIVAKHPMEVLVNPLQPIWTDVMGFYWDMAKDENLRYKNYVRKWLSSF